MFIGNLFAGIRDEYRDKEHLDSEGEGKDSTPQDAFC
jgi:hypothetical protein